MDPEFSGEEEDTEIVFRPLVRPETDPTRDSPPTPQLVLPGSPTSSAAMDMVHVMDMVWKLNSEMEKLLYDNRDRDGAMCDLTGLVPETGAWCLRQEPGPSVGTPSTTGCLPATPHHSPGPDGQ